MDLVERITVCSSCSCDSVLVGHVCSLRIVNCMPKCVCVCVHAWCDGVAKWSTALHDQMSLHGCKSCVPTLCQLCAVHVDL